MHIWERTKSERSYLLSEADRVLISRYKVQRHQDGKKYAVKEMDVKFMEHSEKQAILNEVRLLASVRHPNIVSYYEAFADGNRICIVMEYAEGGDLSTTLR